MQSNRTAFEWIFALGIKSLEIAVRVVHSEDSFPGEEPRGSQLLAVAVIALDTNMSLASEEQRHYPTNHAEVRHLSMQELVFEQHAKLAVDHLGILRNEYDAIAILAMLAEEL